MRSRDVLPEAALEASGPIGEHEVALHREFMRRWGDDNRQRVGGRGFEDVRRIREACIAAPSP